MDWYFLLQYWQLKLLSLSRIILKGCCMGMGEWSRWSSSAALIIRSMEAVEAGEPSERGELGD